VNGTERGERSDAVANRSWLRILARVLIARTFVSRASPNQVTVTRIGIGLVACGLVAKGHPFAMQLSGGLWILAIFLDRVDGELARMTGRVTPLGQRLDYFSDLLLLSGFFVGLGIGDGGLAVWAGLLAGAAVLVIQILAEQIDREQSDTGKKTFTGFAGFDPEDSHLLLAVVAWTEWATEFLLCASIGTPSFAVFTAWLRSTSRRRPARKSATDPASP
jgi:phosphatidylglycerophosphate synthase